MQAIKIGPISHEWITLQMRIYQLNETEMNQLQEKTVRSELVICCELIRLIHKCMGIQIHFWILIM